MPDCDVWYEEVDKGFIDFIKSAVNCEYTKDTFTPIETIPHVGEQDLSDFNVYPLCSVQSIGERFSKDRNDNRYVSKLSNVPDINGEVATVTPSQPFYLMYQINFFAKFKSDIDHIVKCWRKSTGRAFSLPVILSDGSRYKCNTDLLDNVGKDTIDREVRKYIRIYTYRVWVDLAGSSSTQKVATELGFIKENSY